MPSSKFGGGRDFLRSRRRSRWIGGLGGRSARRAAIAAELPETVGRKARCAVDEYEYPATESRPVVDDTGTENTDAVGERGKGDGRGGTGGGTSVGMWKCIPRVFDVTVRSSSLSPNA